MVLDTVENTYKLQKRKKYFFILPVSIKKVQQCIVLTKILKKQLHINLVRHSY
jgi:hypothetical protein